MPTEAARISEESRATILRMQQNELTESYIYEDLAGRVKNTSDRFVLQRLADEERKHYDIWKRYTGVEMKPQRFKIWQRKVMARLLGYTFVIKLMESGEEHAQETYTKLSADVPEASRIEEEENQHEMALIDMLNEERLQYVGSMVLGLNDALVELSGALAGLTLAMQNTRLIALSGLITGISATLSMAASEYLSGRSEGREDALKSAAYTGVAYLITVALLILPYLLFDEAHYVFALITMLVTVVLIILAFNFYISTAKGLNFKHRFLEMTAISLGVAALSFVVGIVAKNVLGVDI